MISFQNGIWRLIFILKPISIPMNIINFVVVFVVVAADRCDCVKSVRVLWDIFCLIWTMMMFITVFFIFNCYLFDWFMAKINIYQKYLLVQVWQSAIKHNSKILLCSSEWSWIDWCWLPDANQKKFQKVGLLHGSKRGNKIDVGESIKVEGDDAATEKNYWWQQMGLVLYTIKYILCLFWMFFCDEMYTDKNMWLDEWMDIKSVKRKIINNYKSTLIKFQQMTFDFI